MNLSPIDVPIYKGIIRRILAESYTQCFQTLHESNKTSIISGYGACINPNEESNKPLWILEIFYIDRLEVCKENQRRYSKHGNIYIDRISPI